MLAVPRFARTPLQSRIQCAPRAIVIAAKICAAINNLDDVSCMEGRFSATPSGAGS
jgi:hypothetical protein